MMEQPINDQVTTIEIPGQPTLWRSVVSPIIISLPLIVYNRKLGIGYWLLFFIYVLVIITVVKTVYYSVIFNEIRIIKSKEILLLSTFAITSIFSLMFFCVMFISRLLYGLQNKPAYIISAQGIKDERENNFLDWTAVNLAIEWHGTYHFAYIDLHTKQTLQHRRSPFRFQSFGYKWWPGSHCLRIPIAVEGLSARDFTYLIFKLVQQNGGKIKSKFLIPQ